MIWWLIGLSVLTAFNLLVSVGVAGRNKELEAAHAFLSAKHHALVAGVKALAESHQATLDLNTQLLEEKDIKSE